MTHTLTDFAVSEVDADGRMEIAVTALDGRTIMLSNGSVADLGASLRGDLIRASDRAYEASRGVWNRNIDKHPALIARCIGAADVVNCVHFAREHNLLVSVRGGGHNFSGTAVAEHGLVIDLSEMNGVRVDPVRHTAWAEGGTKWGQFDRETQAFGLATTGGTNYDTGIAGLTLGGGLGWLAGKYGLALDNLISADIVTADGKLRTVSADEHPDLFWAIRGGGGNFGVVTSFAYQLHEVGPLMTGLAFFPLERAREVLSVYDEFAHSLPDEMNTAAGIATLPDGPAVGIAAVYNGSLVDGERALEPLRRLAQPLLVQIQPLPYVQVQHFLDAFTPEGEQYYATGHFLSAIPQDAIQVVTEAYAKRSSPGNVVLFQQLGNAANRVHVDATAFAHRHAMYDLVIISRWQDPNESARHIAWARDLRTAMQPYATGGIYVNAVGTADEWGTQLVQSAYGSNHQRLSELKRKYDPSNLFRHNQNIPPCTSPQLD